MNRLKIGIVGAGRLGSFHAGKAAAHQEVELIGVFDTNVANASNLAQKLNIQHFEFLESLASHIDAAVIAVPSILHFDIARFLLERGIHLLIEKPMTTNIQDAEKLIELANSNNRQIVVGHTEQFNPAWGKASEMIKSIINRGKACHIETKRTSGYTFRSTDIGVVLDLMIHDLDLVLSTVDATIEHVEAFGYAIMGGHEDFAQARLTFANGCVANLTASRIEREAVRNMKVSVSDMSITVDFASRTVTHTQVSDDVKAGKFSPQNIALEQIAVVQPTFMASHFCTETHSYESADALALEMNDFVQVVLYRKNAEVSGKRAANAIEVAEQILRLI